MIKRITTQKYQHGLFELSKTELMIKYLKYELTTVLIYNPRNFSTFENLSIRL